MNPERVEQLDEEKFPQSKLFFDELHSSVADKRDGFIAGYNAALSESKQMKWTDDDMRKCFEAGELHEWEKHFGTIPPTTENFEDYLNSLSV